MTTRNEASVVCQKCGSLTPLDGGTCRSCGRKPLMGAAEAAKKRSLPRADNHGGGEERETESLRQQVDFLLRENRIITEQLAALEKDFWTVKAGFDTMLDEAVDRLGIGRKRFLEKWARHAKDLGRGIRIRELFFSRKWDILGCCGRSSSRGVERLLEEAEAKFGSQEWDEAVSKLREAHALCPSNVPLSAVIAEFLVEFGRTEEAEPFIRKALSAGRPGADTLRLAVIADIAAGRRSEALEHLGAWMEESEEPYEGMIVRACLEAESGKWTEAQKWSRKAAEKEKATFPLLLLAFSLIMQKKYGGAESTLEAAEESHPDDVEIKHMLHAVYLLKGVGGKASCVKTGLKTRKDRELCARREKYLSSNNVERFLKTIAPRYDDVLGELSILGSVSFD